MNILVTGATGFGRHLVDALLSRRHHVRALGRNEEACQVLAAAGAEIVRADLRDAAAVEAACAGVDAVFHVGALSAAWGLWRDFHAVNVDGTRHVLAGCRTHRVRRLIHVSSPSVVFDGKELINATEDAPYPRQFLSTYSLTKKWGEDLVNAAARDGLPAIIIRPKAIFGPGDTSLLPPLLDAAHRGRLPQVGRGVNLVDMTYVDNVVHALVLALHAERAIGKTYLITNGEHLSLWEAIRTILQRLGLPAKLHSLPYRLVYALAGAMEVRAHLLGGVPLLTRYTTAVLGLTQTYDITAARRDLGYAPLVSLSTGIERTLQSLQKGGCHG